MSRASRLVLVLALAACPGSLFGQAAGDTGRAVLSVGSRPSDAEAWLDGRLMGRTPVRDTAVAAGRHVVEVFLPSRMAWNAVSAAETLVVRPGAFAEADVRLPGRTLIASRPPDVEVLRDTVQLGRTPLEVPFDHPGLRSVLLRAPGWESAEIPLDSAGFASLLVRLKPDGPAGTGETGPVERLTSRRGIVIGSAAVSIVSGVVAAALKVRSDHVYDDYLITGDPASRDRSRRLDTASGIAFGVMEIGMGILMYSLISD